MGRRMWCKCLPYNQSVFYYYVTNLQGDVVGIVDKNGNQIVSYTYDAWGNLLSISGSKASTVGLYNPLRYRGYVYDTETELYYLQSRYYDPTLGRFLNADAFTSTGQGLLGNNMFAYCRNNPVSRIDATGTFDKEAYETDGDPTSDEDNHRGMRASTGSGVRGGYSGPKLTYLGGKMYPNVGGRHGGMLHRTMVSGIKIFFKSLGFEVSDKEERVYYSGDKYRYPDIIAKRDGEIIYIQVGRSKSNGDPIPREGRAIVDLERTGHPVFFYAYDCYD